MAMHGSPPAEEVSTLTTLSHISADTTFAVLRDRFYSSLPYTSLCDSILISVNPFSAAGSRNSDETLREYTKHYRQTSKGNRTKLPPHVFQTACDAYYYMQRTGQDQSILFG